MRRAVLALAAGLVVAPALAQDYEVGGTGWKLERLSDDFVVLRSDVLRIETGGTRKRQGLLILSCEGPVRRIRFQIGASPLAPSVQAVETGRAIVRGRRDGEIVASLLNGQAYVFGDGSFEFRETVGFAAPVMAEFLQLLQKLPNRLEVVLFRGQEARTFVRGTAYAFDVSGVNESLGDIYGFQGLCFRAPVR